MAKVVKWKVKCPDCDFNQAYHSHKKRTELRGKRRKSCDKCGRSFLAKEGRKRYKRWKRKQKKNNATKKGNWHKYSKSDSSF